MLAVATFAPAPLRARCRQITQADLDAVAALLARGFTRSTRDYWTNGFARLTALPPVDGVPRFGYALEADGEIVGVLLLIASRRGAKIFVNPSSWYVEPAWRAYSNMLVSMATKLKHATYFNISPAPHTWSTLKAQGFRQYSFGRSAVFAALGLGGGVVSEIIPGDLPEHDLLRAHAGMDCISVVCEKDGVVSPFVFKPRRLDRPPLRIADLIFSRSAADFKRCAVPLGRWLLKRGMAAILADGKVDGMLSYYSDGKEPRYFKGPQEPADLAYTEKVIFG